MVVTHRIVEKSEDCLLYTSGEQKMTLQETIEQIHPLSKEAMDRAKAHWDGIAKPLHSLGKLEDVIIQIAGITGKEEISIEKRALLTFCADNGLSLIHI